VIALVRSVAIGFLSALAQIAFFLDHLIDASDLFLGVVPFRRHGPIPVRSNDPC